MHDSGAFKGLEPGASTLLTKSDGMGRRVPHPVHPWESVRLWTAVIQLVDGTNASAWGIPGVPKLIKESQDAIVRCKRWGSTPRLWSRFVSAELLQIALLHRSIFESMLLDNRD